MSQIWKTYGYESSRQKNYCCNSNLKKKIPLLSIYSIYYVFSVFQGRRKWRAKMFTVVIATLSCFISSAIFWDYNTISLDIFASSYVRKKMACIFLPLNTIDWSFAIWIAHFWVFRVGWIVCIELKKWLLLMPRYFTVSSRVLWQTSMFALIGTLVGQSFERFS